MPTDAELLTQLKKTWDILYQRIGGEIGPSTKEQNAAMALFALMLELEHKKPEADNGS